MQTIRILQAVTLMMIMAIAASCATGNQYVSKILKPRNSIPQDVAKKEPRQVKFLEFDSEDENQEAWVKDWIKKEDSATGPVSEEILVKKTTVKDTTISKINPVVTESKTESVPDQPVARSAPAGTTRNKTKRE